MVVRDKDVIFELSKRTEVSVCMSVPSVDEEGWKKLILEQENRFHRTPRLEKWPDLAVSGNETRRL